MGPFYGHDRTSAAVAAANTRGPAVRRGERAPASGARRAGSRAPGRAVVLVGVLLVVASFLWGRRRGRGATPPA